MPGSGVGALQYLLPIHASSRLVLAWLRGERAHGKGSALLGESLGSLWPAAQLPEGVWIAYPYLIIVDAHRQVEVGHYRSRAEVGDDGTQRSFYLGRQTAKALWAQPR